MSFTVEELDNKQKFRQILIVKYADLVSFIFDNLKKFNLFTRNIKINTMPVA